MPYFIVESIFRLEKREKLMFKDLNKGLATLLGCVNKINFTK